MNRNAVSRLPASFWTANPELPETKTSQKMFKNIQVLAQLQNKDCIGTLALGRAERGMALSWYPSLSLNQRIALDQHVPLESALRFHLGPKWLRRKTLDMSKTPRACISLRKHISAWEAKNCYEHSQGQYNLTYWVSKGRTGELSCWRHVLLR